MWPGWTVGVVAPHGDDEALGAAAALLRCPGSTVWYGATRRGGVATAEECRAAARVLGAQAVVSPCDDGRRLDAIPRATLVAALDDWLAWARPDLVLLPRPSHHQEHEAVRRAGLAALRVSTAAGRAVRGLAYYEYPFQRVEEAWPPPRTARVTVGLDEAEWVRKCDALRCYASQAARGIVELATEWATRRGREVGMAYAEVWWLQWLRVP